MILFTNKELLYKGNKSNLSIEQINNVFKPEFIGINSFVDLYQIFDGISFLRGSMMFRSKFYKVSKGDWDKIELSFFLKFSNIIEIQEIKEEKNSDIYTLGLTHIPFADDGFGNIIWVDVTTGLIKVYYHEYELDEGVKIIAPNFEEFCSSLENFSM